MVAEAISGHPEITFNYEMREIRESAQLLRCLG
jgi:hypothetical protein